MSDLHASRANQERAEGDVEAVVPGEAASTVRHEEDARAQKAVTEVGSVRARKHVESERVSETVPRSVEFLDDVERRPPDANDSGEVEVLPDGSVSIPIFEEELVVEKRTVVRERVVIRKATETRRERVQATVRKERVEVEVDDVARPVEQPS